MRRSLVSWPLVLLLVAVIHVDWHAARPLHHRLSLDLDCHWTLAIPVFALAAAWLRRRSPGRLWEAAAANLLLATLGAQVVEPLLFEELWYEHRLALMTDALRWTVFAQFMAAGLLAFVATAAVLEARARSANSSTGTPDPAV
ncbi:MAG TPA: hypothetical protein VF746_12035 [Longimicrobium sp.]|jgi:hypothetical protein